MIITTGLVHIYTGNGKGKTTTAVGLATRAIGHGLKVVYACFHKNPEKYGYNEINVLRSLGANVLVFAKGHPHLDKSLCDETISHQVNEGVAQLKVMLASSAPHLLIMDEILISVRDGYLAEEVLLNFIRTKPNGTELVLTGRGATSQVIELAHYVTEMTKHKHPYDYGQVSREGIEF